MKVEDAHSSSASTESLMDHPDPEVLLAYHRRHLAEKKREQLQTHLAVCGTCSEVVLDLNRFPHIELPVEVAPVTQTERDRVWDRLTNQIASDENIKKKKNPPWLLAGGVLAACLALAAISIHLWVTPLQRQVTDLIQDIQSFSRPRMNPVLVDLIPLAHRQNRDLSPQSDRVRLAGRHVEMVLIITPPTQEIQSDYAVEIYDAEAVLVWRGEGLEKSDGGYFTLHIPADFLEQGGYRIRLLGLEETWRILNDYPMVIDHKNQ